MNLLRAMLAILLAVPLRAEERPRPLMRDFMGLSVRAAQFRPELYAPVTRMVRDLHVLRRDVGDDTSAPLDFSSSGGRASWASLYGNLQKAGCRAHASLLLDGLGPGDWKSMERDAHAYGFAFARAFGGMLDTAEIGSEPRNYDDAAYRRLFVAMARGMREGNPRLRIATCAVTPGQGGSHAKSMDLFSGLDPLWDILSIHAPAEVEPGPVWRRSHPEDPSTKLTETVGSVLRWRDEHAKGRQVWVTEFGYDAAAKAAPKTGEFAKWAGCTEEQQAMWNVRSLLVFARMGVDRAYVYESDDCDETRPRGSSGITRNFQPKPAFHALAWLQRSLGKYRFSRVEREDAGECYAYEFTHDTDPKLHVWAVWRTLGEAKKVRLFHDPLEIERAERMPLTADAPEGVNIVREIEGYFAIEATERPTLVWLRGK